jgi:hypothetical protein
MSAALCEQFSSVLLLVSLGPFRQASHCVDSSFAHVLHEA